ncbi:MAG TPA: class I SAM-dependent methyltransferase [Draconibacterium sp.]|nr:class I SAM-dependent methyltransferase [Draconibacterium sp.]
MQKRHKNRLQYFEEQDHTTKKYVIPYIEETKHIGKGTKVLEIGCGEGGNLKAFLDKGCTCTGIDLSKWQINNATNYFQKHPQFQNLTLFCTDIYEFSTKERFDVIVMRDVIEHIPDQKKFLNFVKLFLAREGVIFFGFPPWQMPFGGHQQVLKNKFLSKLPYFHLLPKFCYKGILKLFRVPDNHIKTLFEFRSTGISIDRFERILKQENYRIHSRTFYFINPNYEVKFNLKPRKQLSVLTKVPWLRNFYITAMYYVVSNR